MAPKTLLLTLLLVLRPQVLHNGERDEIHVYGEGDEIHVYGESRSFNMHAFIKELLRRRASKFDPADRSVPLFNMQTYIAKKDWGGNSQRLGSTCTAALFYLKHLKSCAVSAQGSPEAAVANTVLVLAKCYALKPYAPSSKRLSTQWSAPSNAL